MRIGVIDHVSAGGVSRFVANLVDKLSMHCDVESITYFTSTFNISRDELDQRWTGRESVELVGIEGAMDEWRQWEKSTMGGIARGASTALGRWPRLHRFGRIAFRWVTRAIGRGAPLRDWYEYSLPEEVLARFGEFDIVYFAWPYFVEVPDTDVPLVGTFHDFHFRHFPDAYWPQQLDTVERQTPEWLDRVQIAVTSTHFVSDEIVKFFGRSEIDREVVYIAPYTNAEPHAPVDHEVLERHGIRRPYIIYSGGAAAHKNVLSLFRALVAAGFRERPMLVLTGIHTHEIGKGTDAPDSPVYPVDQFIAEHGLVAGVDYAPLGYVSEHDVDELTRAANLVVSASKYEAGCGPALDAWKLGAPVGFSRIRPFVEQTERFGTEASEFDPYDYMDIARVFEWAIDCPEDAQAMAKRSQEHMLRYTWDDVASGYLEVFRKAIESRSSKHV